MPKWPWGILVYLGIASNGTTSSIDVLWQSSSTSKNYRTYSRFIFSFVIYSLGEMQLTISFCRKQVIMSTTVPCKPYMEPGDHQLFSVTPSNPGMSQPSGRSKLSLYQLAMITWRMYIGLEILHRLILGARISRPASVYAQFVCCSQAKRAPTSLDRHPRPESRPPWSPLMKLEPLKRIDSRNLLTHQSCFRTTVSKDQHVQQRGAVNIPTWRPQLFLCRENNVHMDRSAWCRIQ